MRETWLWRVGSGPHIAPFHPCLLYYFTPSSSKRSFPSYHQLSYSHTFIRFKSDTQAPRQIAEMIARDDAGCTIPIVDFARWTDDASAEERQRIGSELVRACREVGFVYIVNHGVSEELLDQAFNMSKKLFELDHKQKMLAPHPPSPEWHRGYSSVGLEKVSQVYGKDVEPGTVGEQLREVQDCKVRESQHGYFVRKVNVTFRAGKL